MGKNLIRKWWFLPLTLGVIFRLILMPITLHPDLWGHSIVASFFAYEGKLDIYDYLANLPPDHPLVATSQVQDIFIYPPATYFTLGIFRLLVKPLTDPNFVPTLITNPDRVYQMNLYWHLFIFKLPYLFFDVGLAFLLSGLFFDPRKKKLMFILWMANPLTLYATFMVGQLDILPTFFTVLALYLFAKGKSGWGMVSLGVGGSYKLYPLLLILPAAFISSEKFRERIKLIFLGFLPFVLSILPFINSPAFRWMVFSPKSQKMLYMNFPVSGAEGIFPFILLLLLIYFFLYYTKKKVKYEHVFAAVLLLIYSVTHYHPQWFLWVTPFLILELVENNFKHIILVIAFFLSWLVITLFFEPSLSYGLFNPIIPSLRKVIGLTEIVAKYFDVFLLKSIVRSVFAGASLYYVLNYFTAHNYNGKN